MTGRSDPGEQIFSWASMAIDSDAALYRLALGKLLKWRRMAYLPHLLWDIKYFYVCNSVSEEINPKFPTEFGKYDIEFRNIYLPPMDPEFFIFSMACL